MSKEDECQIILNAKDNIVTAFGYLTDGPVYIKRDGNFVKYHEDDRKKDMKRMGDSVQNLNRLYNQKKCEPIKKSVILG